MAAFSAETPPFDPRCRQLPQEARTPLLRESIERGLEQLIRLREGQFSFSLTEGPPRKVRSAGHLARRRCPTGINAQELLLDLARGMDEDRRDSTAALEASFAEPEDNTVPPELAVQVEPPAAAGARAPASAAPSAPAPPAPTPARAPDAPPAPAEETKTILLVDDEDGVRAHPGRAFRPRRVQRGRGRGPGRGREEGRPPGKASIPFLLVTDLGMPTSGARRSRAGSRWSSVSGR